MAGTPYYQDEEIDAIAARHATPDAAAAALADSLATRLGNMPDISVDGLSVNYRGLAEGFRSLAVRLRNSAAGATAAGPVLTGVSIGDMDSVASDDDRPRDTVTVGMHQSVAPLGSSPLQESD